MKKDRNYWLERGKDGPKREGYVCIGKGDFNNWLKHQLKIESGFLLMDSRDSFSSYQNGNSEKFFYYLTEQKFNELFPEQKNKNMNRKFRIKSEEHSKAIQNRLFELGHRWSISGDRPAYLDKPFLFAEDLIKNITHSDSEGYFNKHEYIESTLDDLFENFKPIKVKLNNKYTAAVHKDKIVVACQEFSMEVFEEIKKAVDKVKI